MKRRTPFEKKLEALMKKKGFGVVAAIIIFIVGGPLTALGTYFIWRTKWSTKKKMIVAVVYSIVLNIILFAITGILWKKAFDLR